MKLITVVGAALLTVGAGGLISGLGGEYFFCIPVYDVAGLQPGWGSNYECPSWSCAAWSSTVPDWSQDTATSGANRSLFLPRMWWLFPTVSMQSLGLWDSTTNNVVSGLSFVGFTNYTGTGGGPSGPQNGGQTTWQYSFSAASQGTPFTELSPIPYGQLGEDANTVLISMAVTGFVLFTIGVFF